MALSLAELEKDYKKWEAGKAKQAEMANKSNQPAPTFRKVPTLDELSRKQANDRVAETSKQAEKNMRAKERNNVSGVMGDNNASRYNSRFSLDKEVLKDAGRNLSQMAINNAMAQEEEARYNAERIEESRARREASRKRIEDEVKAIQNKGDLASQEEFDRYDELLNTAQGRGFIEHDSPYLVSREKYNQLAKTTNIENDIAPLAMAYSNDAATRGRGVRAIEGMGYNSVDDYVDQLSKRYELTPDEIKDVYKTYQSNKTRAQEEQMANKMYDYGQKHPVLGGALSALASPASGVEGYYNTAANILTGDDRNQSHLLSSITEEAKRGGAESYDSKAAQNAYNFIVGGAGMALNAKGGLPAIAAMGGNTANDAMNMAIERGVAPEQAAAYGLAAGGADTLFNAMGFNAIDDALKKETVKSVGDVLRNLGVGALTEAGENVAQDITQTIADEIINGQNSEIRQTFEDYVYSGMSAEDAFKQTAVDYAEQLGGSAATGAIGGAIFSGIGMAGQNAVLPTLNKAAGKVNDWKIARDSKNAQDLRSRLLADEVPNLDENYRNQIEDLVANNTDEVRPVPTIGDIDVDNIDWGRGGTTKAESAPRSYKDLLPENPFYETDSYKQLENERAEIENQINELEATRDELFNRLDNETISKKSKEEMTPDEYITSMFFLEPKPTNYTEEGNRIKESIRGVDEQIDNLNNRHREILDTEKEIKNGTRVEQLQNYQFAEPQPATQNEYEGFDITKATNTGMQEALDSGKATIVEMSPLEYLRRSTYDIEDEATLESVIETANGINKVHDYADAMRNGDKFPILDLTYEGKSGRGQEGRTRALAAYEAGIDKVPVAIVGKPSENPNNARFISDYEFNKRLSENPLTDEDINNALMNMSDEELREAAGVPRVGESPSLLAETPTQAELNTQALDESSLRAMDEDFQQGQNPNKVMAEDIGAMPRANAKEKAESIESEPVNRESFNREGEAKFMTNTAPGAGIYGKVEYENSPVLQEMAKIAKTSNEESYSNAMEIVNTRGQEWYDDVVNGKYQLGQDANKANTDFDTGMIILQGLADQLEFAKTDAERQAIVAQRNALLRKMKDFSHNVAIGLQAHAKWSNTADGAIMAGERLIGAREKVWAGQNKSKVEGNKTIAQALAKINDGTIEKPEKVPLTHEQIRDGIKAEIEKEFGSVSDRFTDTAFEYLTSLVENHVSTDIIADEIVHYLNHGEFFTIDESLPMKKKMSSTLVSVLKNMGNDSLKEKNKPLDNGYPKKSHATIVEEVRNTLETEYAGLGLDSDTDVEFIATMIEEGVPKWKIEDEINHRLDTGEWYTLDESTRVSREKSSKLVRAFKEQGDKTPKKEKQEIGFAKRKERIINTLEDEFGSIDGLFTDEAINKLVDLEEKLSASQLIDQIEHYLQHGEFYELTEDAPKNLPKMGALSNMLDRISGVETPKAEKTPDTYEQIREKVENTFADDSSSFEGNFNDSDYDFLATMFYEKVPKWLIEDELRYRMEHGEWYTIDESIDSAKPKNQRFKNALNSLVGEPTQKAEKPAPTLDELREQIRNTLEEEPSSTIDVTDENIDYLAGLMSQGATTAEIADALNTYMATGSFGISAETQAEVNSYFKAMDRVNPESKEYAQLQAEAFRLIANEVNGEASALEKFDAWRYLAMLGNPKTMLRNFVGNTMFNAVTGISNTVAALGEEAADRRSIKKTGHGIENRTRAVINPFDRGAIKTAKNDFDLMRYVSGAGTKYKDTKNALRDASSVFDSKAIQLYEKFVNAGISDTFAVRNKYATSLLGYMKANGLTQADMDASYKFDELNRLSRRKLLTEGERAEMESLREIHQKMEDARDFALKEAEYATFHEDNKFADTLSKWSNDSAVAKVFIDGMMPFKKTPANVLRSGLEYSPLGIAKSGYLTIKRAKEMKGDYADTYEKTGLFDRSKTKEVKRTYANDVIDSWSKSLTGTGLAALGYLLYSKGVLQSGTEDEKYQDDLEGLQNFSIKLNGHTYTIDWAAPAVMPLLLGAEVKKVMDENAISGKDVDADEVIRIINSTLNPIMETSMLQGVQNTLETVARQASNSNGAEFAGGVLGSLATNLATGYVTQAIPTLSGQLARTLDGTRRATDTVSTTAAGSEAEKQLRKTANKIPFLSRINNPYVNARGETQSNNPLEYSEKFTDEPLKNIGKGLVNFAYQSVSPGYLQKIDTRPSDEIARRAYNGLDENGKPIKDADVFANWKSQVKINGQKLDPDQMYNYRVASGQANTEIREQLAQADWFNHLSADRQTEILKNTNSLVDHIGKAAADPTYTTENSAFEAYQEKGIDGVVEYYYESAHNKDIKNALGSSADFQKQLYDSGDEARMAKYREGLGVAQQIMPDKKSLSEEQFLKYEKYGADALKKELSYAKKADDLGVSNNKTFQTLVNKGISDESIKKAYDAITAIKTGEDEYGRDEFMPFNEDSYNLYQKYGSTGLKEYQEMKKQNVSYETWQQAHKTIPTLTKSSYINMFKAMDGKTGSKPDGDISQKELLYLFNKNNYSDAQAKAYWNAFGKISGDNAWKSVPVLKYNKKTGKNEWTTESKKKE